MSWPEFSPATVSASDVERRDLAPIAPFGTPALCRLSWATASQIEQWYRRGIMTPEQNATRGGARRWSTCSVVEAKVYGTFAEIGLPVKQLQQLAAINRVALSRVIPAVGFDLRARALLGIFILQIKGVAAMFGRSDDANHLAWVAQAEAVAHDATCWRTGSSIDPRLAALLACSATVAAHAVHAEH